MARTTVVTCIEAGHLEEMVVLQAASLRSFDSQLGRAPILAIRPRPGPSLRRSTRKALATLDVALYEKDLVGSYGFHGTLNKSAALNWAEKLADTELLTWMDGDTVCLREPDGLLPAQGIDFNASPGAEDLGTDGADATSAFWTETSRRFGIDHMSAALIPSNPKGKPIFEYYQGGVFSFRRALGLGAAHFDIIKRLIDMRVASKVTGVYHHDQMAMTYAALKCAPHREVLAPQYNHPLSVKMDEDAVADAFNRAHVLHYHNCFDPAHASNFIPHFSDLPEPVQNVLAQHVPISYEKRPLARLRARLISRRRNAQAIAHARDLRAI